MAIANVSISPGDFKTPTFGIPEIKRTQTPAVSLRHLSKLSQTSNL